MRLSIIGLLLAASASAQTSLTQIGAAGAVKGSVRALAPNAAVGRILESGKEIYLNDHVTTDASGHLQVLLLDETVFTLGPSADMVLDTFVYDPSTNAGQVAAHVVKGAFRFVTGQVARAHPQNMKVGLAVGTIGVRGTVVLGETGPDGSTVIDAGAGPANDADERPSAIIVSNAGVSRTVDQTGEGVTVKPGQSPSFPKDMTAEIERISSIVEPTPAPKPSPNDPASVQPAVDAGELVAEAKALAIDSNLRQQAATLVNSQAIAAFQASNTGSSIPDGVTTWDAILQNLPTGSGYYFSGEGGPLSCTNCVANGGANGLPYGSLQLQVNFSARTIGGAGGIFNPVSGQSGSFIHIHGVNAATLPFITDQVQQTIGLSGGGNPISFSALTGNAVVTLNNTNLGPATGGTGSFNGSTISLRNSGGVLANQAQTSMVFSGSNINGAVSASGTFNSPRY